MLEALAGALTTPSADPFSSQDKSTFGLFSLDPQNTAGAADPDQGSVGAPDAQGASAAQDTNDEKAKKDVTEAKGVKDGKKAKELRDNKDAKVRECCAWSRARLPPSQTQFFFGPIHF